MLLNKCRWKIRGLLKFWNLSSKWLTVVVYTISVILRPRKNTQNGFSVSNYYKKVKVKLKQCKFRQNSKKIPAWKYFLQHMFYLVNNFESKQNNEISWCSSVLPKPLDSSTVLAICLGFASFKFLCSWPKCKEFYLFIFCFV